MVERPEQLLAAAARVADEVLAPSAQIVDQADIVPHAHLVALADAGLMGIAGPRRAGGSDLAPQHRRQVQRLLGGGCGATTFVWAQHHGAIGLLRDSPARGLRERWLGPLCQGDALAGTAFAHLRRPGPPAVSALPDGDGWRLEGRAPWATSWGLADCYSLAARTADGHIVWAVVAGEERPGMTAGPAQRLSVLSATATVELVFDGCRVAAEEVAAVLDVARWAGPDRQRAARLNPSALGVADRCVLLLADGDEPARGAAARLGSALRAWTAADEAMAAEPGATVAELATHRAAGLDLVLRTAATLLAAVSGRGLALDHPAQRLHREAAFYVVQAQTTDGRMAALGSWADHGDEPSR